MTENATEFKFSFNELDAVRVYTNCTYKCPVWLANHNSFNSGEWTNCHFESTVGINAEKANIMGQIIFNNCIFDGNVKIVTKNDGHVQFNNCTFNGTIDYTGNNVEYNNDVNNGPVSITISTKISTINKNEKNVINKNITEYKYLNEPIIWTCENGMYVDRNKYIVANKVGTYNLYGTALNGIVSNTLQLTVVDVDYIKGQYINTSGNYQNHTSYSTDSRYIEVNGGSRITVGKNCNVNINRIGIAEYDENKQFVKSTINVGSQSTSLTLQSSTKYIRVMFMHSSSEVNLPTLYSSYIVS